MIDPQEDFVHDTTSGSAEQSRSRLSHQEWNDREHIIDRFEEEWQAGQSPQIDAYLRMFPNDTGHTLLRELVSIDIEYRTKRGEQLCLDKYFSAFPILLDDPVNVVRLVQEDYALRNRISTKSIDSGCAKQSKHSNALHHSLQNDHFPAIAGYDVIGEIGRGSMGIVYRARQIGLNRTVAIKVTRDSLRADRTRVSRFGIEAAAIARLDHPNIIKIFEVGENNGQLFFSMELADEGSLTDRLKKGPISIREASELVMLIARGVHHAHVRGVVHRDLKPLNIVLVSKSDSVGDNKSESCALLDFVQPKVTDFGLAKVLDSEYGPTVTGDIFGTPGYMAPEQLSDTSAIVGPSTDIYGLGAILYELLTGCPPFRGIDVLSTLEQVRNSQPKSPRQLMPSIPRDLETICLKCLEKEPQRRFLSAELLAEDLRRFIAGEPVLARPVSSFEKCWRLCRRNPLLSCLLSTIFLILFAGMITVVHYATVANSSSEKYLHQLQHARASLVTSQLWRVASSLGQDPGESWRLLQDEESIPRTDRDFVWGMYANHCQSISSILPIKTDGVQLFTVLAVSPNERLIAAADNEFGKAVTIWNLDSVKNNDNKMLLEIATIATSSGSVFDLCFSPDSRLLAIVGAEIRLWDVAARKELTVLHGNFDRYSRASFNHDGSILAIASKELSLWNVLTGEPLSQKNQRSLGRYAIAFSPDGKTIAKSNFNSVWLQDAESDVSIQVLAGTDSSDFSDSIINERSAAFKILSGAFNPANLLQFSSDGRTLASCTYSGELMLWHAKGNRRTDGRDLMDAVPLKHGAPVHSFAFNADGTTLATIGEDQSIRIWDAATGRMKSILNGSELLNRHGNIAFLAGNLLSTCDDGKLRLWNTSSDIIPQSIVNYEKKATAVLFSRDGTKLASGSQNGLIELWDMKSKSTIAKLDNDSPITDLVFSPQSDYLAASGEAGTVMIWKLSEVPTGVQIMDLPVCVACLSCNSDGRLLAIGTCAAEDEDPAIEGGSVIIWDLTSKKSVASLHANQGTIYSIAMHPTGRILAAGGEDGTIVLWDLTIFKPIATLRCQSSVAALAFSPDGERIFAGIGNDVFVWDMKTKSELNHLTGHANNITKIAFTADGKSMATASRDRQIFLWNYSNDRGQHRATIYGGSRTPTSLAFAPNGRILASANDDGAILLYHADNR